MEAPPSSGPVSLPDQWLPDVFKLSRVEDEVLHFRGLAQFLFSLTQAVAIVIFRTRNGVLEVAATTAQTALPTGWSSEPTVRSLVTDSLQQGTPGSIPLPLREAPGVFVVIPHGSLGDQLAFGALISQEAAGPDAIASFQQSVQITILAHELWRSSNDEKRQRSGFERALLFLELIQRSASAPSFRQAVQGLGDELRTFAKCENLAIGLGDRNRCRVQALSMASKFDAKSRPVTLINRLMREAIAVRSAVAWPTGPGTAFSRASDQRRLAEATQSQTIIALPLFRESGEAVGAWVAFWRRPVSLEDGRVLAALSPHLAATAHLIDLARPRGLRGLLQRAASQPWVDSVAPVLLTLAAIGLMFLDAPYPLGADCWLEPEVKRQVAAPFEGQLRTSRVRPGDTVTKGEVLAELEGKEVRLKIAEARSRLEAAGKKRDQALAIDNLKSAQLASLEIQSLQVELELGRYQEENLEIRSPLAGIVLSGDLAQSEGVPVTRGQKLFDLAPLDALSARIAIPATELAHVDPGMEVRIRLESQTDFHYNGVIETIQPVSQIRDSSNVFIAVCKMQSPGASLRPGMRGKARILAGRKKIGWILFHRPWEFIRLHAPW